MLTQVPTLVVVALASGCSGYLQDLASRATNCAEVAVTNVAEQQTRGMEKSGLLTAAASAATTSSPANCKTRWSCAMIALRASASASSSCLRHHPRLKVPTLA